jgi:hypothetical protein
MPNSDKRTSLRHQESSCANGAKSRGPITPKDKAALRELRAQYPIDFAPRNASHAGPCKCAWRKRDVSSANCKIEPIPINEHPAPPEAEEPNCKIEPNPINEHRTHKFHPPPRTNSAAA